MMQPFQKRDAARLKKTPTHVTLDNKVRLAPSFCSLRIFVNFVCRTKSRPWLCLLSLCYSLSHRPFIQTYNIMCSEPTAAKSKRVAIRMRRKDSAEKLMEKGWEDSTTTALTLNTSWESLMPHSESLDTPSLHQARKEHVKTIKHVLRKVSSVGDDTDATPKAGKKKLRVTSATAKTMMANEDVKTPLTPRRNLVRSLKERLSSNGETPKKGKKK